MAKKKEIYYARMAGKTFFVRKKDASGKFIPVISEVTGGPIQGQFQDEKYLFEKSHPRKKDGERIDCCYFTIKEDTDKDVADYVRSMHAKGDCMTEIEFEKFINPARHETLMQLESEQKKTAAVTDELNSVKAMLEKANRDVEELKKRSGNNR